MHDDNNHIVMLYRNKTRTIYTSYSNLMVEHERINGAVRVLFTLGRVLRKTRLIFSGINGPIVCSFLHFGIKLFIISEISSSCTSANLVILAIFNDT